MIDILFPVHNRREFTEATARALVAGTPAELVRRVSIYDDASVDGAGEAALEILGEPFVAELRVAEFGGPVAVMSDFLDRPGEELFAKVDNDTMLPAGWLEECLGVMRRRPELGLLGLEAMYPVDARLGLERGYQRAPYIGGIGLMRRSAFVDRLAPSGYFGFTSWQDQHAGIVKGWLDPALPVCLLDRVPVEPWRSLSEQYVERGWQRVWAPYTLEHSHLWGWFE